MSCMTRFPKRQVSQLRREILNDKKTLIIVFHSYPTKPCIDGLLAIIFAESFAECNVIIVPYWRTDQSFQRLKGIVEDRKDELEDLSILYVDCAPDLEQEVEYLLSIIEKVPVHVMDHHPEKKDTPLKKLKDKEVNFKCLIDEERCGAKLVFDRLLKEKHQIKMDLYRDLLVLVHFSDYEGVKDKLSDKPKALKIANAAFAKARENVSDENTLSNFDKIIEKNLTLYYILDKIMAVPEDWKFFYDDTISEDKRMDAFVYQKEIFLAEASGVVSGMHDSAYTEEATSLYLHHMADLEERLKSGAVLDSRPIGKKSSKVFVCHADIMQYGRSLEPYVQAKLKELGADYAILMNNPTENKEGELSYYFSLRRDNDRPNDCNARDLADYIKEVSGTKIGGGHPWASGVVLNPHQHRQLFDKEDLTTKLKN